MNFFDHKDLGNHLLQLCPKVVKHPVYIYICHMTFDVLLTAHLSIFISVINQLDAQNFCFKISVFHASTCFEHHVLIIRRSKLHYKSSGIITHIGGRLVHEAATSSPGSDPGPSSLVAQSLYRLSYRAPV